MPSKKKKYNARFPPARIKKIMQTDEDVGKVAAAVPVIISRALELFIESLILKASDTTRSRNAKTLSTAHIKHIIQSDQRFDFLKDLVANIPDIQPGEDEGEGITSPPDPKPEGSRPRGRPRKKKPDGEDGTPVTKRPRKYVRKQKVQEKEDNEETDSATEEEQGGSEGDQEAEDMDEDAEDDHEDNGECDSDGDSDHMSEPQPTCSTSQHLEAPGTSHQTSEPLELTKSSATSQAQTTNDSEHESEMVTQDTEGPFPALVGDNPKKATQDVGPDDRVPSDIKPDPDDSLVPKTESEVKTETPVNDSAPGNPMLNHPPPPFYPGMLPAPTGFYGDPRFMPPMFPNNHVQPVQNSVKAEDIPKPKRKRGRKKGKSDLMKHERTLPVEAGGSHMDPNGPAQNFGMIPPVCVPMTTGYFPAPGIPMPPYFAGGPMPGFHPAMMNYPPMAMPPMVHPGMGAARMGLPFPQHMPPMMDPRFRMPDMNTVPMNSTNHPSNHLPPGGSLKAPADTVPSDPQTRTPAEHLETPVDLKIVKPRKEEEDYDS